MMDEGCCWQRVHCVVSEWRLESVLTVVYGVLISGIAVLLPHILKFKYLIAHIYVGENLQHSMDQEALNGMMDGVQRYYQKIIECPKRDVILETMFGRDVASIILQFLPALHASLL